MEGSAGSTPVTGYVASSDGQSSVAGESSFEVVAADPASRFSFGLVTADQPIGGPDYAEDALRFNIEVRNATRGETPTRIVGLGLFDDNGNLRSISLASTWSQGRNGDGREFPLTGDRTGRLTTGSCVDFEVNPTTRKHLALLRSCDSTHLGQVWFDNALPVPGPTRADYDSTITATDSACANSAARVWSTDLDAAVAFVPTFDEYSRALAAGQELRYQCVSMSATGSRLQGQVVNTVTSSELSAGRCYRTDGTIDKNTSFPTSFREIGCANNLYSIHVTALASDTVSCPSWWVRLRSAVVCFEKPPSGS